MNFWLTINKDSHNMVEGLSTWSSLVCLISTSIAIVSVGVIPKMTQLQSEKTMKYKLTIKVKQCARQRFLVLLLQQCLWVT